MLGPPEDCLHQAQKLCPFMLHHEGMDGEHEEEYDHRQELHKLVPEKKLIVDGEVNEAH